MRFPRPFRALIAAVLACTSVAAAAEPTLIIAIGDSITQGGQLGRPEYTYRWPLTRLLADEGHEFVFVGTRSTGLSEGFRWPEAAWCDRHEGYYGATTRFVVEQVGRNLASLPPPDVALVHLGTNDNGWLSHDEVIVPMSEMIAALRARNPAIAVLVYQPTKRLLAGGAVLHRGIRLMAERLDTPESKVAVVEDGGGAETFDGVHPDEVGQAQQASRWMEALRPILRPSAAWAREPRQEPAFAAFADRALAENAAPQCNSTYIAPTGNLNSTVVSTRFSATVAAAMPFMSSAVARVSPGLRSATSSCAFSTRHGAWPNDFTSQPATAGRSFTATCTGP